MSTGGLGRKWITSMSSRSTRTCSCLAAAPGPVYGRALAIRRPSTWLTSAGQISWTVWPRTSASSAILVVSREA